MSPPILSNKFCSVDAIRKMGSYPIPREGRLVSMMNKVMTQELKGAIIFGDKSSHHDKYLGFFLDKILSDGTAVDIPSFNELTVPRRVIKNYNPQIVQTSPPMSTSRSMTRPLRYGTGLSPSLLCHHQGQYPIPPRHHIPPHHCVLLCRCIPLCHLQPKKLFRKRVSSQHFSMQFHWPLGKKLQDKILSNTG